MGIAPRQARLVSNIDGDATPFIAASHEMMIRRRKAGIARYVAGADSSDVATLAIFVHRHEIARDQQSAARTAGGRDQFALPRARARVELGAGIDRAAA
jgi:hypothetical protein